MHVYFNVCVGVLEREREREIERDESSTIHLPPLSKTRELEKDSMATILYVHGA
jgi:hypothetical protein